MNHEIPIFKPSRIEWTTKIIKRDELVRNRDKIYLFGDNLKQIGKGGMAAEMRGEPNAIGIPTKKVPSMVDSAFFSDTEFAFNVFHIFKAFLKIPKGKDVIVPSAIGKGLAELDVRAPLTYKYLTKLLASLYDGNFNWTDPLSSPEQGLIVYTIHSMLLNHKKPDLDVILSKIK